MVFFRLMEFLVIFSLIAFVVTQVIIPASQKRALFPLFRKQGKLEKQAAELRQKAAEEKLQSEVNELSNPPKRSK